MRLALYPLALTYAGITSIRNKLFEKGWLNTQSISCPVISVGNITVGGTGKTPMVKVVVDYLVERGHSPSIISRGYRGSYKGVQIVDPDQPDRFGDEPSLLAQKCSGASVVVASDKVAAAMYSVETLNSDVIVADDAFQHRWLPRDLDLLLIDATEPLSNYHLLPAGRLREPLAQAVRADMLVLTKANLVSPERLLEVERFLNQHFPGLIVVRADYHMRAIQSFKSSALVKNGARIFIVSGIARPEIFEKGINEKNFEVVGCHHYKDHFKYSEKDADFLLRESEQLGADFIVTTEKDLMKLKQWSALHDVLAYVPYEIEITKNRESLLEKIDGIFREDT